MKNKTLNGLIGLFLLLLALPAKAVCPVCIVAVGAGLGLSEYLGIDDSIAGLWIGGLLVAIIIWTISWLDKKKIAVDKAKRSLRNLTVLIAYYLFVIWPLDYQGFIGNPGNKIFGADKLLLGMACGSLVFLAAASAYEKIKETRGRAHFPFEKVVLPLAALTITSLLFYFLII